MSPLVNLFFVCGLSILIVIEGVTKADINKKRIGGDFKILKGAIRGDPDMIRAGINGGGNINTVLSEEIGEKNFKLGKPHVDFPVAPAIHVAVSGGTQRHLRTVHMLLIAGADFNLCYFQKRDGARPVAVYHPAIYYAIGAFGTPNSGHAGLVQNLLISYPEKYNHSKVVEWVQVTGTPPPLHVAIMRNFFEGVYLLTTTPVYDINTRDLQGLAALHVAAWLGNSDVVALLVHNGADIFALDRHNRTFLHYAALRGVHSIAVRMITNNSAIPVEQKLPLIHCKDKDGRTALDLALLPPAQMRVVTALKDFEENVTQTSLLIQNDTASKEAPVVDGTKYEASTGWLSTSCSTHLSRAVNWGNVTALSSRKIWSRVDRIRSGDSSGKSFFEYYTAQRPVVVTGNVTGSMGFWKYGASSREMFLQSYGGLEVNVSAACGEAEVEGGRCFSGIDGSSVLREYLQRNDTLTKCIGDNIIAKEECLVGLKTIEGDHSCGTGCCDMMSSQQSIATSVLPSYMLDSDFTLWKAVDPFRICTKMNVPGTVELRVASGRVVSTPLSAQSATWNVLLVGEKRHWYLVSPGAALLTSIEKTLHAEKHPEEWVRQVFGRLRRRRLAVEVIQYTGDVLFIPHGWYHISISSGEVIDLSNQFCTLPGNLTVLEQIPTGMRIYGARTNSIPT